MICFITFLYVYRNGLKLLSWNDAELTPKGPQRLRYEAEVDECRVSVFINISYSIFSCFCSFRNVPMPGLRQSSHIPRKRPRDCQLSTLPYAMWARLTNNSVCN